MGMGDGDPKAIGTLGYKRMPGDNGDLGVTGTLG